MADEIERTIVVAYDEDTQRKRAEYLMDETHGENFSRDYQGLARRFEGTEEEFQEAYANLAEKVPEENIRVETAETLDFDNSVSGSWNYDLDLNPEVADSFVHFWFSQKAPGAEQTGENSYDMYSKKFGAAHAEYEVSGDEETDLEVEMEAGSEEALQGFKGLFEDELDQFSNAQR